MSKVLLDGDIVAYRAAFSCQDDPPWVATQKADDLVHYILEETIDVPFPSPSEYQVFLSGRGNFRKQYSEEYKAQRLDKPKPEHLTGIKQHLTDKWNAVTSVDEEADDLIAIEATKVGPEAIICSIDKDFLQVPCRHFNFVKGEWSEVTEFGGLRFFYTQILTGDAADNVKGIHRVGPKTAEKILKDCSTEEELYKACVDAYEGDTDKVLENARLLWLRRTEGEIWEPPIK